MRRRQRDTYVETRVRARKKEMWEDEVPTRTLCRHFHESLQRTSGCLVDRFLLARPIASVACGVYQNTHLIMPRVATGVESSRTRLRFQKSRLIGGTI